MIEILMELLFGMIAVLFAALLFVNAIEFLGCYLRLGRSFVGAILAPLFTSFPEMVVFLFAIFAYESARGEAIGIGTIFGQPFMASSLSYGLVGISVLVGYYIGKREDLILEVDKELVIPYLFVTILFPLTLLPPMLNVPHQSFGILFLFSYLLYIWLMFRKKRAEIIEDAEKPYFCKIISDEGLSSVIQLSISLVVLYTGSHNLIHAVDSFSKHLSISPLGIALILVPAATAIPETASALIWGYRGKDTLSIASLVGEKILYSTFYPGIGLLLTSWALDVHAYLSVFATTFISLLLLLFIARQRVPVWALCFGLVFFISYSIAVFIYHV